MHGLDELGFEARHVLHGDLVGVALGGGEDADDLIRRIQGRILRLLQKLRHVRAAVERLARRLVEVGAELREARQLPVLRQIHAQAAGDLLHRAELRSAADTRDRKTHVDGRTHAGVEQIRLKEDLTVRDGDDVRRDIGGDIARLRLDDGQRRHAAAAQLVGKTGRALEKPGVQIEHVAGVRLASGRALQEQGNLTVGDRLLGEVVIHDQDVLARIHERLADGGAGVRRDIEHRRGLRRVRADDGGIVHGAVAAQGLHNARDGGFLLADGDIDADHVLALLVQDRVDGDGGFAGLAVADDQLTLTAADRHERVDGLDAGLERHGDALAVEDARRGAFDGAVLDGVDRALSVHGTSQRVHDAADHAVAHGHLDDAARTAHRHALLHVLVVAEQDHADVFRVEVHDHAAQVAREVEHFARHDVGKTGDAADAVRHADDLARLEDVDVGVYGGELPADGFRDRLRLGIGAERVALHVLRQAVELVGERAVIDRIADAHAHAADEVLVHLVAAGDERLTQDLRELLHLLVGEGLGARYGNIQFLQFVHIQNITRHCSHKVLDLLDEAVCKSLTGFAVLIAAEDLRCLVRHEADRVRGDAVFHVGAQLRLGLGGVQAHLLGLLRARVGGGFAVFGCAVVRLPQLRLVFGGGFGVRVGDIRAQALSFALGVGGSLQVIRDPVSAP